eukprot:CAMPEP_0182543342 /NCGR_PEP_ID=MMETSP1323-20130603/31506_1 /TAXON_ID=236787 /ORGANISM="Florenciella parvula, Strain RCC1693" /LENGTH=285 /DNA_ID=CAMNT_0024754273 /DNA_START=104 /DNA_END=958 /DNA_ORIENTATION=+
MGAGASAAEAHRISLICADDDAEVNPERIAEAHTLYIDLQPSLYNRGGMVAEQAFKNVQLMEFIYGEGKVPTEAPSSSELISALELMTGPSGKFSTRTPTVRGGSEGPGLDGSGGSGGGGGGGGAAAAEGNGDARGDTARRPGSSKPAAARAPSAPPSASPSASPSAPPTSPSSTQPAAYSKPVRVSDQKLEDLLIRQFEHCPRILNELRTSGRKTSHWAWWAWPTEKPGFSEPSPPTSVRSRDVAQLFTRAPAQWQQILELICELVVAAGELDEVIPQIDHGRI